MRDGETSKNAIDMALATITPRLNNVQTERLSRPLNL
jgi:hypothetical protein